MSKVTGKDLQRLIEGALNEKYGFKGNADDFLKNLGVRKTRAVDPSRHKVAPIRSLEEPKNKYTAQDVASAITGDDEMIRKAASVIATKASNDEFRKDMSGLIDVEKLPQEFDVEDMATDTDIKSITFPRPLSDLSTAGKGKFLGSQNQLIQSVFAEPTLPGRLKKIDKISTALSQPPENLAKMDARKLLQFTMVADLFDLFLNQLDQRAAGYVFESFLANLVGGKVEGGSNGIADFESKDGQKGSAKLYRDWTGISQSHLGYDEVGESIHYVIALHGAAQEERRTTVALYYVVLTLQSTNEAGGKNIAFSDALGDVKNRLDFKEGSKISFDLLNKDDYYIGKFDLSKADENYRKRLTDLTQDENVKGEAKDALSAMKQFFTHLYNAEENTKKYTAQKDGTNTEAGDEALKAYDEADTQLEALLNILTPGKTVKGEKGGRKITKEHILKLIEESFNK
tara:strand:- start:9 stop:1379 length:1371 start_codon:yes stop_codon:yes gene_type:complete